VETCCEWMGSTVNVFVMRSMLEALRVEVAWVVAIWLVSVLLDLYNLSFWGGQMGHLCTNAFV